MTTIAERYVRLRVVGHGDREAAREAGYSGNASPAARALVEDVKRVQSMPNALEWLQKREAALGDQLADVRRLRRAAELASRIDEP